MSSNDARLARNTVLTVLALVALRLVVAAWTPLTFDEAYYWMWSKNLAGGYYDHPPAVAYVIRAGTMIAGDTELGVRLASILLAFVHPYITIALQVVIVLTWIVPDRRIESRVTH